MQFSFFMSVTIVVLFLGRGPSLRMLTPSTLRKTGICGDHFLPESFWNETRKKLRPNQNPIPYAVAAEEDEEVQQRMEASSIVGEKEEETQRRIEGTNRGTSSEEEETYKMEEEDERGTCEEKEETETGTVREAERDVRMLAETSHNDKDDLCVHKEKVLKTYPGAIKANEFVTVDEENDEMEWCKIEPPLPSRSSGVDQNCDRPIEEKVVNITKGLANKFKKLRKGDEKAKRKSARKIKILQETLKAERTKHKREMSALKQKKLSVKEFLDAHHCTNSVSRAMVTLQLRKGNRRFTKDEKDLVKRLNYYSASAYRHMRKAGLKLPAMSSIRKWIGEYDIKPGFSDAIYDKLKEKMNDLPPEQRICGLKWDEFSCKKFEEYSKYCDLIEGLVDLGPLGRQNAPASTVLVFSLDSLDAKNPYSQPISYFLTDKSTTGEVIAELVKRCLSKLAECGSDVRLLTCDQASTNQNCIWKSFGATEEKPYFEYEGRRYFCSFDIPHLIKRLLAQLRTHQFLYDVDGNIIANFQDYVAAWNYDRKSPTSNLLSHITEAHMDPNNWEVMNVLRAFHFFSKRFATAIRLAGADPKSEIHGTKEHPTQTWKLTAAFAEEMDKFIDATNAYKLVFHNPAKRPLSSKNPHIEETLKNFLRWSSTWTMNPKSKSKAPCLKGLPFTVNAILSTYHTIRNDYPNFDLAVGLCNQDSLEHLFSKIRQRGGHVSNPTARMVRLSLRHILCSGMIEGGSGANVQIEDKNLHMLINTPSDVEKAFGKDGEELLAEELKQSEEQDDIQRKDIETTVEAIDRNEDLISNGREGLNEADVAHFNLQVKEDSSHLPEETSFYERNAVTYFAGYVASKLFLRSKCESCRDNMMKTPMEKSEENEYYIRLREYQNLDEDAPEVEKLTRPTNEFTRIIYHQLKSFESSWENYWASSNLLQHLSDEAEKETKEHFPEWFKADCDCCEHRISALRFMLRVKVHAKSRERNGERQAQVIRMKKRGRKVNIVMNN